MTFEETLSARFACKKFSDKAILDSDLDFILEAGRLAPSSHGFEPWKFLVIGKQYSQELAKSCYEQENVTTASYNIALLARWDLQSNDEFARKQVRRFAKDETHFNKILGIYTAKTDSLNADEIFNFSSHQCYIALAQMMSAAKVRGIDSCAIGGFERDKAEAFLGIKAPFGISVILSLGYAADTPKHSKKRQEKSEVVEFFKK